MKNGSAWGLDWRMRRSYRWFIFSDVVLICRPSGSGFTKKLIIKLTDLQVSLHASLVPVATPAAATAADSSSRATDGGGTAAPSAASSNGGGRGSEQDNANTSRARWAKALQVVSLRRSAEQGDEAARELPLPGRLGRRMSWSHMLRRTVATQDEQQLKPEVFFVHSKKGSGTVYKCWAESEAARVDMVELIQTLTRKQQVCLRLAPLPAMSPRDGIDGQL